MTFEKGELKFIVDNVDNFMDKEFIGLSDQDKFIFMYLNSMVGRYETGSKYDFKKLRQKDIKSLKLIDSELITTFIKIYDFVHFAIHCDSKLNEYVDNKHIASTIYEVVHYILFEEFVDNNNVQFLEFLKLPDIVNAESTIELYKQLSDTYDKIRNNKMLIWIRDREEIDKFQEFKRIEIYSYMDRRKYGN